MHKLYLTFISLVVFSVQAAAFAQSDSTKIIEGAGSTQASPILSLDQVLKRVYQHHPQLWKLRAEHKIWDARIRQAGIGTHPELSLVAEDILGSAAFTSDRFTQVTLGLAQTILLGDKLNMRSHLAQLNQQLQYWDYQVQAFDLAQQVYLHYGQLSNLQAEEVLIQDLIANARHIHGLLSLSVARGKLAPNILYQSELTVKSLESEGWQVHLKHKLATQTMAALWGSSETDFRVEQDLSQINLDSRDALFKTLETHPRIARWETEQKQRQSALDYAQAQGIADLNVSGGLRYHAPFDWGLVLSLGIPLTFNNPQQGHIDEARLRQEMWAHEKQLEEQALHNQLEQAYELVQGQIQWLDLLKQQVELAQLQQTAAIKAFEAGKFSYLDVLNAAQNRMHQLRQLQVAKAEHLLAVLKVKALAMNHSAEE